MTRSIILVAMALGFALSATAAETPPPAPVASLTEFTGRVSVNVGEGFAPALMDQRVKPGDRVMAQDNSEGTLKFFDECELKIHENTIVTVPVTSTCKGGTPLVQQLNPAGGAAIGATGTGNGGVWAMVAIVAAIDIWWLHEDDDDTVSP